MDDNLRRKAIEFQQVIRRHEANMAGYTPTSPGDWWQAQIHELLVAFGKLLVAVMEDEGP